MIKLQELTPEVYYKQSRDFQFIGRLFDLVLNYSKTNCDTIYNLPINDNTDEQLMELLSLTLGFTPKYKYTSRQLRAICSVLPLVLRNKGNVQAFVIAATALINAEELAQEIDYQLSKDKKSLTIYVPQDLSDITILNDLFDYLLPAGMTCKIVRELRGKAVPDTEVATKDIITIYKTTTPTVDPEMPELYDSNYFATLTDYNPAAYNSQVGDTAGMLANSVVYKPENEND